MSFRSFGVNQAPQPEQQQQPVEDLGYQPEIAISDEELARIL